MTGQFGFDVMTDRRNELEAMAEKAHGAFAIRMSTASRLVRIYSSSVNL